MEQKAAFAWNFQRRGGLDQATLRTGEEMCRLGELDPKLQTALSCPAAGREFDSRTLALLDSDKDGRIRIRKCQPPCNECATASRIPRPSSIPAIPCRLRPLTTPRQEGRSCSRPPAPFWTT